VERIIIMLPVEKISALPEALLHTQEVHILVADMEQMTSATAAAAEIMVEIVMPATAAPAESSSAILILKKQIDNEKYSGNFSSIFLIVNTAWMLLL
jgi:hypothetical protein